jgi:hypothetical protein
VTIVLFSLAFAVAALCAGLMGYAIQRGATCTVAAVDELVGRHKGQRLLALLEASLWVAGGLLVVRWLGLLPKMPPGYAVTAATVGGGVLLGFGAWVNRACVFGAIARFGSGEWAYLLTPLGFYVGCLTVGAVFAPMASMAPQRLAHESPVLQAPAWVAAMFVVFAAARLVGAVLGARRDDQRLRERVWSPHAATTVIGITFLVMLLLVGAWAYTDVLSELARGMAGNLLARALLLLALLAGAALGGWTAGRFRSRPLIDPAQWLRCFSGGVLMGWGSLLIPGGNDGLILVGMPLLWPYAWLAFGAMCVAIAAAQMGQRVLGAMARVRGVG